MEGLIVLSCLLIQAFAEKHQMENFGLLIQGHPLKIYKSRDIQHVRDLTIPVSLLIYGQDCSFCLPFHDLGVDTRLCLFRFFSLQVRISSLGFK